MGSGNLNPNGTGKIPAHPSAWSKIRMGWIDNSKIAHVPYGNQCIVWLRPIESGEGTLAIKMGNGNRYLMAEFKDKIGYDSSLPYDGGVVVYHVNESAPSGRGVIKVVGGMYGCYYSGFTITIPRDRFESMSQETILVVPSLNVSLVPLTKNNSGILLLVGCVSTGLTAKNTSGAISSTIKFRDNLRIRIYDDIHDIVDFRVTDAFLRKAWELYSTTDFLGASKLTEDATRMAEIEYCGFLMWIWVPRGVFLLLLLGLVWGITRRKRDISYVRESGAPTSHIKAGLVHDRNCEIWASRGIL